MMIVEFSKCPHLLARPLLFMSPKCRAAVPVHSSLVHHVLEQATLDSSVCEIQYRAGPRLDLPPISLAGVVLRKTDGTFLLHDGRLDRGEEDVARVKFVLERYGLRLLRIDEQVVFREPFFSNAGKVWSHAGHHVALLDRLKFSAALAEGPKQIIELQDSARPDCDVLAAVCALACETLVQLDLHAGPLGPQTIVEA